MHFFDLFSYFPEEISSEINEFFKTDTEEKTRAIEEIRLRIERPIILKFNKIEIVLNTFVKQEMILKTLEKICDNSIYSFQNQIKEGFITIKGGHRIGITGNCVIENDRVSNISHISSLNFRIAKQILGASDKIIKYVINTQNNDIYSTLIVSPPGVRKDNSFKRFSKKN